VRGTASVNGVSIVQRAWNGMLAGAGWGIVRDSEQPHCFFRGHACFDLQQQGSGFAAKSAAAGRSKVRVTRIAARRRTPVS
jgi:hypothetical protein